MARLMPRLTLSKIWPGEEFIILGPNLRLLHFHTFKFWFSLRSITPLQRERKGKCVTDPPQPILLTFASFMCDCEKKQRCTVFQKIHLWKGCNPGPTKLNWTWLRGGGTNADQYVSVVLGDSRHTRSYRCAASSAAASRVDPMSDHCMVSPVTLCYALPQ